ncbi:hypothetical protein K439DRAFT_798411 [Ramaria rubella]|nr:hypothetical protein K439DRAFT_798411 [Ramaria rubella]
MPRCLCSLKCRRDSGLEGGSRFTCLFLEHQEYFHIMSNVLQAATLPIVLTHLKYLNMITASSLLIQLLPDRQYPKDFVSSGSDQDTMTRS